MWVIEAIPLAIAANESVAAAVTIPRGRRPSLGQSGRRRNRRSLVKRHPALTLAVDHGREQGRTSGRVDSRPQATLAMPLEAGRIERNEHTLQRVSGNRRDLDDAGSLLDQLATTLDGLALGYEVLGVPAGRHRDATEGRASATVPRTEVAHIEGHAEEMRRREAGCPGRACRWPRDVFSPALPAKHRPNPRSRSSVTGAT